MDASWKQELQARGLHADVIVFMEKEQIICATRLANYIDARDEVQKLILAMVPTCAADRSQKALLTELWREADHNESLRLTRKASGGADEALEDPIDAIVLQGLQDRFEKYYHFKLGMREMLCDSLMGRLRRELDKRTFSLISVDRVKTAREASKVQHSRRQQ